MDVFLIPVGHDRYELYCEVPDEDPTGASPDHDRGWLRGLIQRFRQALAEMERERNAGTAPAPERGLYQRLRARFRRLIANTVAEQRLLWHMRRQTTACLVYPADADAARMMQVARVRFRADYDRHLRWLVVNTLLFVLSGLLTLVPGPNVIAYYFAFRLVGHYLSMRGARQALERVQWTMEGSQPLADLRPLSRVDCAERRPHVEAIAGALELEHLVRFFDRVAVPTA